MNNNLNEVIISKLVDKNHGYSLDLKLSPEELARLQDIVSQHWIQKINSFNPLFTDQFKQRGIKNYHTLSNLLPHDQLWHVTARILPRLAINEIREMHFMKTLEDVFGKFIMADEENVGYEEIRWRIARPQIAADVGPMHADRWFVDLGHGIDMDNRKRVKVWIALHCEPGLNGLSVVPGSHYRDWNFHGEIRQGITKPQFDETDVDLPILLPATNPGDAIIFHDNLLHKGVLNQGTQTRVSLEFTMFVSETVFDPHN